MKKLLSKNVDVYIKYDNEMISGLMFDIDDECVYIQQDVGTVIVIPKDNIKYYTTGISQKAAKPKDNKPGTIITSLKVFVDKDLVADMPVDKSVDLSTFNDKVMGIALSNKEVAESLMGRVQTSSEYYPGSLYIETVPEARIHADSPSNTFGMTGGGSMATDFLSPTQIVERLSKLKTQGK